MDFGPLSRITDRSDETTRSSRLHVVAAALLAGSRVLWARSAVYARALKSRWQRLNLSQQFGITVAAIVLMAMTMVGRWVTSNIEEGVINNSAVAATLYMDAFVGPLVQELANGEEIGAEQRTRLNEIMALKEISENIVSIKVWRKGGVVAYSNFPEIIGRTFAPTGNLKNAWTGVVSADLDGHSHEDDLVESKFGVPLLEIYAPIRERGTNRIIAVAEFYLRADNLQVALGSARLQSWGVVGSVGALLTVLLWGIVRRGSQTIEQQQRTLALRADQNSELREKIEKAYWRADRLNEQFLRRLGADLHDGPAQLLGYALMSLDDLPIDKERIAAEPGEDTHETIRQALEDAIRDIRNLSRGLMLPELETMTLNDTVSLIVRMHEERTGSTVSVDVPVETIEAPAEVKICTYRFIQEALTNAFKHARGAAAKVTVSCRNGRLRVAVSDDGPGLPQRSPDEAPAGASQLGLVGIRDRVETLKGRFEIQSPANGGTVVQILLECSSKAKV